MVTAITETKQVGGSLMVLIPKSVKKAIGLKKNQLVQIELRKVKPSSFGKFKGIGELEASDKLDTRV